MRKTFLALLTGALVVVLSVGVGASIASSPQAANGPQPGPHDLVGPLGLKQRELRAKAVQLQLQGDISKNASVAKVGKDSGSHRAEYVELHRQGEDSIWTVLGEFGTQANPALGGTPGPLHNAIPQPDRHNDNTTIWTSDFSRDHYLDLLFSEEPGDLSMRNFYIELSSNRYTVNGDVTDWGLVPYNEANYGADYCGSIVCARTWLFVRDSVNGWYNAQLAAGKSAADIDAYLSRFDKWDRYDQDGDGNFNEPDGYIDHFQSIHAGDGQETGGGAQGTDAIWSHRWYVQLTPIGAGGPTLDDGTVVPLGGTRVGGSKYWIGDYTIEPENGGVGVFSHEFAHDLGLPDEYDTSGNTGGAENSTAWWTLMSQGSYGTDGTEDLGSKPTQMSSWDKLQLGWLNYISVNPGEHHVFKTRIGPAEYNSNDPQAVVVNLPDKQVTSQLGAPFAGSKFYYSGTNDDLDNTMTKSVALPVGATLTAKARYNIEQDWDYAYLRVSTDGGTTWTNVPTNLSTSTNPNNQNFGEGITGSTGGAWVDLTANLAAYGGKTVLLGFRYWTDGAQQGNPGVAFQPGLALDEIAITGQPVDGAEAAAGWTFAPATGGFRATTGTEEVSYYNSYIAEYRNYFGFDESLQTGPYQFGFLDQPDKQDWVEHFPYQDGVLIWYWDTSQADNNVGDHPGSGLILPIDSHPEQLHWSDGTLMRPRLQSFDSPFTPKNTDKLKLHKLSVETKIPRQHGVDTFDDTKSYWVASDPADGQYKAGWSSVKVPATGTKITVDKVSKSGTADLTIYPAAG